jgi:hypothetical protein
MTRLLCLILSLSAFPALAKDAAAEALTTHTIVLKPRGDGPAYVSLHDGKVYDEQAAIAHKGDLDFVYLVTREPGSIKRELFDLSGHDARLPPEVLGAHAGIIALSWSDDLVARCKTVADLKRMTGSYTTNSFTFYAIMADNAKGELDQKRYIFLDSHDRMGLFTIKQGDGDTLILDVKITP